MNIPSFILFYCILLLIGTLAITGFYIVTRGERNVLPDGRIRLTGKIFKRWSLFWERTTGVQRLYFQNDRLKEKYKWLCDYNSFLAAKLEISADSNRLEISGQQDVTPEDLGYIRDMLMCDVHLDRAGRSLSLSVDEPIYYFPEWLRFPLSQCPPCMASVGGSLIYWSLIFLPQYPYAWSSSPEIAYFLFWLLYMLSLAALNKLVYNQIGS